MASLPVCPPSPKELLAEQIKKYDPRGKWGQAIDDKTADAANASEGLLDMLPNVNDLLSQASNFLAGVAGDLVSTLALENLADVAGSVLGASGILSLMVAINMLGDSMSMMFQIFIIDNLRKQVAIRLYWLHVVQFHIKGIYQLMLMLKTTQSPPLNYSKVVLALRHVKAAEALIVKFKTLQEDASGIPKVKSNYFTKTFVESDQALKILMGDSADGSFASDISKGLRKSISTKGFNSAVFNRAKKEAFNTLKKKAIAKVLGRSIYIAEGLAWNIVRLLPPIPIPGGFGVVNTANKALGAYDQAVKLGYAEGKRFHTDDAEKQVARIKEQGLQKYAEVQGTSPTAETLQLLFNKVNEFDFEKGLLGTNLVITGYIDTLASFDSTWDQLNKMSNYLLAAATPVEPLINEIRVSMESSIEQRDSTVVVDIKTVKWIAQLSLLDTYKKMFSGAISDQAQRADQARNIGDIKKYLASDEVQGANDGAIPALLQRLLLAIPLGVVPGARGVNEVMSLTRLIIRETDKYIKYNNRMISRLSTTSLKDDPSVGALNSLLGAMGVTGGLAGAMASSVMLGQLAQFANLMALSIASIKGISAFGVPKCTVPTNVEDPEKKRNQEIERKRRAQGVE